MEDRRRRQFLFNIRNPEGTVKIVAESAMREIIGRTDKDVVRRVLAKHHWPRPDGGGPSWLAFTGHAKDSLWSVDLFRCESITLKTHWVQVEGSRD